MVEVTSVRSAAIELDHTPGAQRIEVPPYITVRTREPVSHAERVSCGIPGHQHAGQEIIADVNRVDDPEFSWELRGRCGFAAAFTY